MNQILSQDRVTDGYDVRVSCDGQPPAMFHFPRQPADVQAAVDGRAAAIAAQVAADAALADVVIEDL